MKKTRLISLTDNIFSIVMTLTIFQFKVPSDGNLFSENVLFWLMIYVTSFIAFISIWVSHHHTFSCLLEDRVDHLLLWVNSLFLLVVTIFPFVTVAHAQYPQSFSADILYSVVYLLMWLGSAVLGEMVNRLNGTAYSVLPKINRLRLQMIFFLFLPCAILSLFWIYVLPIITVVAATIIGILMKSWD